jgi:hypothetical protein
MARAGVYPVWFAAFNELAGAIAPAVDGLGPCRDSRSSHFVEADRHAIEICA